MRKMGGLANALPFAFLMLSLGSLALMGFPFLSGYYSKEFILEYAMASPFFHAAFAYWLGTLAAGCTAFYSFRLLYLVFLNHGVFHGQRGIGAQVVEGPTGMAASMLALAFFSLFSGYFGKDYFIGPGSPAFGAALMVTASGHGQHLEAEFLPFGLKCIPLVFSLGGTLLSLWVYHGAGARLLPAFPGVYAFFHKKWYFDLLYNDLLVQKSLAYGYGATYRVLDRGLLEVLFLTGGTRAYTGLGVRARAFQTGHPYHLLWTLVLGGLSLGAVLGLSGSLGLPGALVFLGLYASAF